MSPLQRRLVKGRPTKKKLIKFAHEKVIKSKWRAEIAKEDQRPPKLDIYTSRSPVSKESSSRSATGLQQ